VKLPIKNLYYLFAYAWRYVPEDLAIDVGAVENPDILNLCAHVLTTGIDRLLRRGIDKGYIDHTEESSRVRGRLDLTAMISGLTWLNARAVCRFDELSPDILHNQILRTTIQVLKEAPVERSLMERLRDTDRKLSGISAIRLTPSIFRRIQLHRNNSFYAFLIHVCELVHKSLLPDRAGEGPSWFRDVLSDEDYMSAVFEEFVRNFYSLKQTKFMVGRSQPRWNATAISKDDDLTYLPTMMTDITLRSSSRTIIIDTKYYRDALQSYYGHRTVHSNNLYQLTAYLRGSLGENGSRPLAGILLYPVGHENVDLHFKLDGFPIRIYTLNLNQPTQDIESDLLSLLTASEEKLAA
jgi:5-methylcytosine-specific restriction enzyme subunit McrC